LHIAGPFDEEIICDYDQDSNNLSCDFKGIELKGTLEYTNRKWRTSGVIGYRKEHATQIGTLEVKMDCKFKGSDEYPSDNSVFDEYNDCYFDIKGTGLDGVLRTDNLELYF